MRVFVVCREVDDGYSLPLAAFSTKEAAQEYSDRHVAEALKLNWVNFYDIEELTVDHPAD